MTQKKQLFNLYQKLYEQRAVLTQAPALTIIMDGLTLDKFPVQQAENEVKQLIAYLLGVKSLDTINQEQALGICLKAYANQPFWKDIVLDYLEYQNTVELEKLNEEGNALNQEGETILQDIQKLETQIQDQIQRYANQIEAAQFKVDAHKLIKNYLNMAAYNPETAYKTLTQNPAYFAPIKTQDKQGNTILTPDQATQENKRLAKFLAQLIA